MANRYQDMPRSRRNGQPMRRQHLAAGADRGQMEGRPRLGYLRLQELKEKDPLHILLTLGNSRNGCKDHFNNSKLREDFVDTFVILLAKAFLCKSMPQIRIQLINTVRTSEFLKSRLPRRLSVLALGDKRTTKIQEVLIIKGTIAIIKTILEIMPNALENVHQCIQMLKSPLFKMDPSSQNDLADLDEQVNKIIDSGEHEVVQTTCSQDTLTPPNDFRDVDICPMVNDLELDERPFLRVNKTKGRYVDLDHYLDVQFRLLREDFVRPLREGINWYKNKEADRGQQQNIRLYRDVEILYPCCTPGGVAHVIHFNTEDLRHVVWEFSKRLLYGSLVCLSGDGFETIILGTVVDRTVDSLKKGEIQVCFQNLAQFRPDQKFVMIETEAYFESYRHVLRGIQNITADEFPFQRYIVQCESQVRPLEYMKGKTLDFSCLIEKNTSSTADVKVLDKSKWPSAQTMKVDESQHAALQAALTQEVSIIQGPPGTGKTYLGLKIVELLLLNKVLQGPLLVVCYTNHALDQFLEGILDFLPEGIVRVGGRSKSDFLSECTLQEKKKEMRNQKMFPREIAQARHQMWAEVQQLKTTLEKDMAHLAVANQNTGMMLKESLLFPFMSPQQRESLCSHGNLYTWLLERGVEVTGFKEVEKQTELEEPEFIVDEDDERILDEETDQNERHRKEWSRYVNNIATNDVMEMHAELLSVPDSDGFQEPRRARRNVKKLMTRRLRQSAIMDPGVAERIRDVWALPMDSRWELYRWWISKYKQHLLDTMDENMRVYDRAAERLKEAREVEDLEVMRTARVVGMTTTGAARYQRIVGNLRPPVVIVEEAAEVLEAHIITTLPSDCQHLILIGDHKQLRPSPCVYELANKYHLDCSLFERMVNNDMPCVCLQNQHRMRPEISVLMRPIYPELRDDVSVMDYENIRGVQKNVFFVNHGFREKGIEETKSKSNEHEAEYITALANYFLLQGYDASQITILTTYTGQFQMIRKMMKKSRVRVCVVDNYQGEENDIILLSLVRSNEAGKIGFLKVANRVCVALSRAKKGFFVIGNITFLSALSDLWSQMTEILQAQDSIGEGLLLICQNHPWNEGIRAATAADFEKAPEGGCLLPCEARLDCGHVCKRVCHVYDQDHTEYKCQETCGRIVCTQEHRCPKKCHMACGNCMKPVEKKMPFCHHKQMVPCSLDPQKWSCRANCEKLLECGHQCPNLCGQDHERQCQVKNYICTKKCTAILTCSHQCPGKCGLCREGRVHVACQHDCGRILVCGHQCREPCSNVCPPCQQPCENRCVHSECRRTCGEPCASCREPCTWSCPHFKCTRLCFQPCNRPPCSKPCRKPLEKCGHRCIGLCGEPCPTLCRQCDEDEVTEIFFGEEDEPTARFVQLEDCKHVIESKAMDRYMGMVDGKQHQEDNSIQLKKCPKCSTPIRRSQRYRQSVNNALRDIEAVKRQSTVNVQELKSNTIRELKELEQVDAATALTLKESLRKYRTSKELENISFQLSCAKAIANIQTAGRDVETESLKKSQSDLMLHQVETLDDLKSWILQQSRFSEQQSNECVQEISRIRLIVQLLTMVAKMNVYMNTGLNDTKCVKYLLVAENALDSLNKMKESLTKEKEDRFERLYEQIKEYLPDLTFTEIEREMIVKAMGVRRGAWFKCPKGHYYCIGECGGAMEESKCPGCGSTIGGTSHQLRGDNTVATEMDGARYAAWSEQANMGNYDLENF